VLRTEDAPGAAGSHAPALVAVLLHLRAQPQHRVLELRVLLQQPARRTQPCSAARILRRRQPGEAFSGGAKVDKAQGA
jgi:hypothetical protein